MSKAPPVPQISSSQASESQTTEKEGEVEGSSRNADADGTQEGLRDPTLTDRIIEEEPHEVPPNRDPIVIPQSVPATQPGDQLLLQRPEPRVPRQADDRLFTWAAVGLTVAIVVLLLKKFLKAGGHGAFFTDES